MMIIYKNKNSSKKKKKKNNKKKLIISHNTNHSNNHCGINNDDDSMFTSFEQTQTELTRSDMGYENGICHDHCGKYWENASPFGDTMYSSNDKPFVMSTQNWCFQVDSATGHK